MTMPQLAAIASPQPQTPRLLACVADDVTREMVERLLGNLRWQHATVLHGGVETALRALSESPPPTVLLVDLSDTNEPLAAMDELAGLCPQTVKVLAIGNTNDIVLYRELIGMGVVDYLMKPVPGDALRAALQRAARTDEAPRANPAKKARVIALIGARGGVGATTVAIGAGWCMAHEQNLHVALLDLDLHFGNLALSLDLEPGRGLREALEHPERTDGLLIAGAMTGSDARFRVLAAEEALETEPRVEPDAVDALLGALNPDFDCVVVDLPRRLDGTTRRLLAIADVVALVTDMSLPGMRDTMRLLAFVRALRPDGTALVIASRVGGGRGEIPRADFERGIGGSIDEIIPFDAKAAAAIAESGKPLPQAVKSGKATAELSKIGRRFSGRSIERPRSLLRRLMG
jgi:pilus assembly protein CpaE